MAFNPLIIVAVITFFGIVISSVILAIINSIADYLIATGYDKLPQTCSDTKEKITSIVDEDITRIRWMNAIMLVIFIIVFILSCVGIYFTGLSGSGLSGSKEVQSAIGKFFKSSLFLYIVLFGLIIIFLIYTIFYGILLGKIASSEADCFSGDPSNKSSDIGNFNRARNLIVTQFIVCIIMLILVSIIIGVIFIYKYKKSSKEED